MRSRTLAFAGLLVGGLFCLIAGSQPWWRARGDGASVTFSGTDATAGLTQALGVVALVGGVLALALRRIGRRILAVLLALAGAAIVVIGVLRLRPGAAAVQDKVRQVSLMDDYSLDPTFWNLGYAAAGVLVLLGSVVMLVRAGRWPARPDRFARQSETEAALAQAGVAGVDPSGLTRDAGTPVGDSAGDRPPGSAAPAGGRPDRSRPTRAAADQVPLDPALWWKAQDAGADPTLSPAEPTDADPDSAIAGDRETMPRQADG